MGGGVPGHPLDGPGGVDQLAHLGIPVIGILQLLGQLQGVLQGDMEGPRPAGDLLGDGVHIGIGHIQHPPYVPHRPAGRHGAEGDDLGHMVAAVFSVDIVDDLLPPADAEVDVNIRHGNAVRIEEALEVQAIFHGIQVGDVQTVGHHGTRRRTAPRPHRDPVSLRVRDEVRHNEEVVHKAHLLDHAHLIFQLLPVLLRLPRIPPGKAPPAQVPEVGLPVVIALRQLEMGQVVFAELELHIAQLRDADGVLQRLRSIGEEPRHLRLALDIELLGLKLHPPGIVQGLAHLDAHEDVLHLCVLPPEVVGIVGGDQGDARLLMEAQQPPVHLPLDRDAVVLELQIVAVLPKQLPHLQGGLLCLLIVPRHQQLGDLSPQAGGAGDQSAAVLPQQVQVDARLNVKALQKRLGDHVGQIAVALFVPAQEHQVGEGGVKLVDLLKAGAAPGGHIDLAADDGLDPRLPAGPVKVDRPVHDAVIGDGYRVLPQLLHPLHQLFDPAGSVQKGKFRMQM